MSGPRVHPTAAVSADATLEEGVEVGPYCVVGAGVRLGAGTRLLSHAVIEGPAELGPNNEVHPFAVLGGSPQDRSYRGEATRLEIGGGNVFREHVTVHRGTRKDRGVTRIGSGGLFMAGTHVAHDAQVGDGVTLANGTLLAGHVQVGNHAVTGGLVAIQPFVRLGESCFLAGGAMVEQDIPPFTIAGGDRARVRALNKVGLRRREIPEPSMRALEEAFRLLFRSGVARAEALAQLQASPPGDPWVQRLLGFLAGSRLLRGCKRRATACFVRRGPTRVWRVALRLLPFRLLLHREGTSMPRLSLLSMPLSRNAFAFSALLAAFGVTSSARAECPPGSWFCADAVPEEQGKDDKTTDKTADKADDKKDDKKDDKAEEPAVKKVGPGESAQVPAGTTVIVQTAPPAAAPPPPVERPRPPARVYAPPPPRKYSPPPRQRSRSEWGFNMRLQSALMENDKHPAANGAGMGGLGFSLRARPTGHLALDFGLDFIGGRDFNGNRRSEIPFSINAMLFVNPRDRAQLYFIGGLGWSSAHVERADESVAKYSYFGFQTGVGVEYRATRHLGLNLDLIGFIRGRTDPQAKYEPEFVDPATGRTTNTSGGGLFRGGLTVYW